MKTMYATKYVNAPEAFACPYAVGVTNKDAQAAIVKAYNETKGELFIVDLKLTRWQDPNNNQLEEDAIEVLAGGVRIGYISRVAIGKVKLYMSRKMPENSIRSARPDTCLARIYFNKHAGVYGVALYAHAYPTNKQYYTVMNILRTKQADEYQKLLAAMPKEQAKKEFDRFLVDKLPLIDRNTFSRWIGHNM